MQLDKELGSKGLKADFTNPQKKIIQPADQSDITEAELEAAILTHKAIYTQPSIKEKLASFGLSLDELKNALEF